MLVNNISDTIKNSAKTSVSPLPTAAFPIDARTYFESYADAESAAAQAEQQGSTNTIYYFGMTLVVYENDEVAEYLIVRDPNTHMGILKNKSSSNMDFDCLIIDGGSASDTISD